MLILRRGADGVTSGSGPFRIAEWQPGRHALLTANDDYWGGRPYLDAIEIADGARVRAINPSTWNLAKPTWRTDSRRCTPRRRARRCGPGRPRRRSCWPWFSSAGAPPWRTPACARRSRCPSTAHAIHNVLLPQAGRIDRRPVARSGSPATRFCFPRRAIWNARARRRRSHPNPACASRLPTIAADPLARPIAERIALNAREAGVVVQVAPGGSSRRAARARAAPVARSRAGAGGSTRLRSGWPPQFKAFRPSLLRKRALEAEQKLLDDYRVVPLFHVPQIVGLSPRVRNWDPEPWGDWRLDDVWLESRRP